MKFLLSIKGFHLVSQGYYSFVVKAIVTLRLCMALNFPCQGMYTYMACSILAKEHHMPGWVSYSSFSSATMRASPSRMEHAAKAETTFCWDFYGNLKIIQPNLTRPSVHCHPSRLRIVENYKSTLTLQR